MNKQQVRDRIAEIGIVPVVRASSAKEARAAAEAVCEGGIPIVEVTLTVPGALDVIRDLVKSKGASVLIGVGTVLDADAARQCLDAGAQFLVTPGFDLKTVEFAAHQGLVILAGALTPTEIITAWKGGADFVKVFPCGNVGGAKYIRALRGPLPQIPLVPTGGVNLSNAAEFIEAGAVALGVGGELVEAAALKAGKLSVITENARRFMEIIKQSRAHNGQAAEIVSARA
jgi:2-dehydro-3-deoxyphosphogluconate aldolase/(4S)-4-hydroxy-2-oxoglutarate aldolase